MKDKFDLKTIFSFISMCCMVTITILAILLYKNVTSKLNMLQTEAQKVTTGIENVATDIQEANLPGIAENINNLASDATSDLSTTMEKIDSIDIDALNNSINRLDTATSSFESVVNGFRGWFS